MITQERRASPTAGFTLMELIVVIVILGILAVASTVVCSGYMQTAHKGADRQTVSELIYAAILADYADPSLFGEDGRGVIILTGGGTIAAGTCDPVAFRVGLTDAMGSLSEVSLAYTGWSGAVDSVVFRDTITQMDEIAATGNAVSYAANADALWSLVEETAEMYALSAGEGTAAEYVAKAAGYTTSSIVSAGFETASEAMGNAWEANTESVAASFTNSAAGACAQLARNCAFAEYLRLQGAAVGSDAIAYLQGTADGSSLGDTVRRLLDENPSAGENEALVRDWAVLNQYAHAYLETKNSAGYTQAYTDGMVYYYLMYCIDERTADGTFDAAEPGYLEQIGAYVSAMGAVLTMDQDSVTELSASLGDIAGSVVVITAVKDNGALSFGVTPADADPGNTAGGGENSGGDEGADSCREEHTEELILAAGGRAGVKINGVTYDETTQASVVLCTIDPAHMVCPISRDSSASGVFTWETISNSGVIALADTALTALKPGTAQIRVTYTQGSNSISAVVNVTVH